MVVMDRYHAYPIRLESFAKRGKKVEKNLKLAWIDNFPSFHVSDF